MKVFLSSFFAIFCWMGTVCYIIMFPIILSDDKAPKQAIIVLIIMIIGTYYLGLFFWRKSKRDSLSLDSEDKKHLPKREVDNQSLVNVSTAVIHEAPKEILNEMEKYYSKELMQGDLRILDDSISLMKSTKDIETFISRSDLAMRKALTIEQAKNANITVQSNIPSSKEVMDLKFQLLPNVLNTAYISMSSEATKLKTAKGRLGRYQKFLNYLLDNEYELDLCDNYEEIVSLTRENISNLQIQLKYS